MNNKIKSWEEEFDKTFYEGERNATYCNEHCIPATIHELKSFIRQLLASTREEATALARREERERVIKIRENEMKSIGHLQHRCPQCGKETKTPMTYLESYRINALWGRCFECAGADLSDNIK